MTNPFEVINNRLRNIEFLLQEVAAVNKQASTPPYVPATPAPQPASVQGSEE